MHLQGIAMSQRVDTRVVRRLAAAIPLLVLLLALSEGRASAQVFNLGVRVDFATGSGPKSVISADLNGDGKIDLVTANTSANSVSVLLGDGIGGFGAKTDFATATSPWSVAAGDVNADGKIDLVTANNSTNSVSVLLGDGLGGFGPKTDFGIGIGRSARGVAIGDINDDGKPDLAVAHDNMAAVSVMLGNGAGGFGAPTNFSTGTVTNAVALGDLNGDGRLDLAATNGGSSTVSILLGNGTGGFGAKTDYPTGAPPLSIVLADANADGKVDMATGRSPSSVSLWLGNGLGGFGPRTDFVSGSLPGSVALSDVTGDGKADLVCPNSGAASISVLAGDGAGGFGAKSDLATGTGPNSVALTDVNGDGRVDLVSANETANTVSVLLGNGVGSLKSGSDFASAAGPSQAVIADVSGDGKPDVVTANSSAHSLSVLLGNGTGGFGTKTDYASGIGATGPAAVAIGDVNSDGKPDIVAANAATNRVGVLLGNGTGGFGAATEYTTAGFPASVAIVDLNGDTRRDLVTANYNASSISVLLRNNVGGFNAKTDFTTGSGPGSVAVADVNGDGKPDVVTANSLSHTVSVLLGTGTGGFGAKTDFATGTGPFSVAIADLSGDGKPDLAVANNGSNTVQVLLGDGTGGFGTRTDYATPTGTRWVTIGDMNGDGRPDLVAAGGSASIFLGNGLGAFGPRYGYTTGVTPYSVAVGDVSVDGRLDLVTANHSPSTITVMLGLVPTRTTLTTSPNPLLFGSTSTLTANVSIPAPGYGTPSDSVRFLEGTTPLGTARVNAGVATLAVTPTSLGDHAFTAEYKGDAARLGSFSSVAVLRAVPGLSIGDVSVYEADVSTVTATFTVSLSNAINRAVTVNYATEDGSATAAGNDYAPTSGSLTIPANALSTTFTVTVKGDVVHEGTEAFTVVLSGASNAVIADAEAICTILDNDPIPRISINSVSLSEGQLGTTSATFTVSLSNPTVEPVTVRDSTADGTATIADNDYVPMSGLLTIPPYSTSATVSVTVNGDALDEADEVFFVDLWNPMFATISTGRGRGTILDDDAHRLSINDVSVTEGNSGTVNAVFTVSLPNASGSDVTVEYLTKDKVALAGGDYVATLGQVTIPANSHSATITVQVLGDTNDCGDETFEVALRNPVGASIADSIGTGTILSDDGAGSVTYAPGNIELHWNDCVVGAASEVFDCASNSGLSSLVASFVPPGNVTSFTGLTAELEVLSSSPLPAWWQHGPGSCRGTNSLDVSCDFLGATLSCADPWQSQGDLALIAWAYESGFGGDPSRARLRVSCELPAGSPGIPLDPNQTYSAFVVNVLHDNSTGGGSCAGCSSPVTIVLRSLQLVQAAQGYAPVLTASQYFESAVGWQSPPLYSNPGAGNFSIGDVTISEGASQAVFTVTRTTFDSTSPLFYQTSDGSASAGGDYLTSLGTIAFPPEQDSVTIAIPLVNDAVHESSETFLVTLSCNAPGSSFTKSQGVATITDDDDVTGVGDTPGPIAGQVLLEAPQPNPAHRESLLPFSLPHRGHVTLRIYDPSGRLVRTLVDETREAGVSSERWDGRLSAGIAAPAGVYLCELRAEGVRRTRRLIFLR